MSYNKARDNLVKMYLESLEEDKIPWEQPWTVDAPKNAVSDNKYNGINNLILSYVANKRGYKDNRWCTFKQMKKNHWHFKENAKGQGVWIEFWSKYNIKTKKIILFSEYEKLISNNPELADDYKTICKNRVVFNADLIDGIPKEEEKNEDINRSEYITNIIKNIAVSYKEEGNEAYYNPKLDEIHIPKSSQFKDEYSYYATQLHELSHATGHPSRLNRDIINTFGSEEYAKEELRAEISSSFMMQKLKLNYDENHYNEHKSYIRNWIDILKNQPTELFKAIKDSDEIVNYLDKNGVSKDKKLEEQNQMLNPKNIEQEEIDYEK